MTLAAYYPQIRLVHIGCVTFSGALFTTRGILRIANVAIANHRALRVLSYAVDTLLLVAAILLTLILHQYPLVNAWLTTKLLLLILYIALGTVALKRAQTAAGRSAALITALAVFAYIIGVAITHQPEGWLLLMWR